MAHGNRGPLHCCVEFSLRDKGFVVLSIKIDSLNKLLYTTWLLQLDTIDNSYIQIFDDLLNDLVRKGNK